MKRAFWALPVLLFWLLLVPPVEASGKPRVLVLTDISNEPDDEESLVRFLVYANEYDIEGLVATTSTWLRNGPREDLLRRTIEAYARVRDNLNRHAPGFPDAPSLLAVTRTGQAGFGMDSVGEGKSTPGSRWLLERARSADERPLWVLLWGGANTLAQALRDARAELARPEWEQVVAKLRVYSISDQDDAGPWLRREFPGLFYIVSPSRTDAEEYFRATWTGISGDLHYANGPGYKAELVTNAWLEENVIRGHGPLGEVYPRFAYIMEGDTPSFLGLIDRGLGWTVSPAYGGWGGRYVLYQPLSETRPIWTNNQRSRDTVQARPDLAVTSDPATIWRWREHFQNDFAARMDWCVADTYEKANHNPRPVLNGDAGTQVLHRRAGPGDEVTLSAEGTTDPDDDPVRITWWIYEEAGSLPGAALEQANRAVARLRLPPERASGTVHVILQVQDLGTPALFAYRRAVIEVGAAP